MTKKQAAKTAIEQNPSATQAELATAASNLFGKAVSVATVRAAMAEMPGQPKRGRGRPAGSKAKTAPAKTAKTTSPDEVGRIFRRQLETEEFVTRAAAREHRKCYLCDFVRGSFADGLLPEGFDELREAIDELEDIAVAESSHE